jgi:hypothetical protein
MSLQSRVFPGHQIVLAHGNRTAVPVIATAIVFYAELHCRSLFGGPRNNMNNDPCGACISRFSDYCHAAEFLTETLQQLQ